MWNIQNHFYLSNRCKVLKDPESKTISTQKAKYKNVWATLPNSGELIVSWKGTANSSQPLYIHTLPNATKELFLQDYFLN